MYQRSKSCLSEWEKGKALDLVDVNYGERRRAEEEKCNEEEMSKHFFPFYRMKKLRPGKEVLNLSQSFQGTTAACTCVAGANTGGRALVDSKSCHLSICFYIDVLGRHQGWGPGVETPGNHHPGASTMP